MHDTDVDVAVIGYGPTGMVAASLLGQQGHRVLVAERWPTLYGLPRFTHIDGEVARIVQSAADVDVALRDSSPTVGTFVNGEGEVLVQLPALPDGPSGFAEHLSVYQPDIEDAMDARVRSAPGTEVAQGWSLTALTQDDDGVTLTLAHWDAQARAVDPADTRTLRARWVIAADGAGSRARELLGVDQDDLGFTDRWVNVDAEWTGPAPAAFANTLQVCDPARGRMTMGIGARRQRFEFAVNEGEDPAAMARMDALWPLLREHFDVGPDDVTVLRNLAYTFSSRVARQWQVGRVFLAGDAAHTMPPYLGQGACSGMRDAVNLAWKLDLVLRDRAPVSLLDSYEPERRPHATALVHGSVALGRVANTRDPQAAAARDAAFRAGAVPPPPPPPVLVAGVLHTGPDGAVTPPVGGLTPQGTVRREGRTGRLDDVVGRGFLLVTRGGVAGSLTAHQLETFAGLGGQVLRLGEDLDDLDGRLTAQLDALDADAYLARPDFVLFGAGRGTDVGALLDELAAQVAGSSLQAAAS